MATNIAMQILLQATNDTGPAIDALNGSLTNAEDLISTLNSGFDRIASTVESSMSGARESIEALSAPIQEINTKLDSVGTSSKKVSDSMGGMELQMAGMALQQVFQPLVDGAQEAEENFSQFDTSMRQVNQEAGLSQSGFKSLEQQVLSLSSSTGLAANDLSQGLYNIMSTGSMTAAQALTRLDAAAEGAKAGNTDLATTTKALDSIMGAYSMNASQAQQVMDIMFAATQNGQMHFADLANSVGASATSAAIAGVSYQQLAAAQATLTNVGKNAESASQNLNSLITGIIAPTSQATKEAQSLGIEWDASALKAHGLSYMIQEAMTATHGNTSELKALIPNQRAYTAELALGQSAAGQYQKTLASVGDSSGATASALAQSEQSMGEQLDKAKNAMSVAGQEMLIAVAPAISKIAGAVSSLASWFEKLSPSAKMMIAAFAGIIAVVAMIVPPIVMLAASFMMLDAAAAPVLITIGVIVALAAAVAVVIAYWKPISDFFKNLWNGILGIFQSAWNFLKTGAGQWVTAILAVFLPFIGIPLEIAQHWTQIKTFFIDLWNGIVNTVRPIVTNFIAAIQGPFDTLRSGLTEIWNGIKDIFEGAWTVIKNVTLGPVLLIIDLVTGNFQKFHDDLGHILQNISDGFHQIWDGIGEFFQGFLTSIQGFFSGAWNGMLSIVKTVGADIGSSIIHAFDSAVDFIKNLPSEALQWGEDIINGIIQGIKNAASAVGNAVNGVAQDIRKFLHFSEPDVGPLADFHTWMPDFMQGMASDLTTSKPALLDAFNGLASDISGNVIPITAAYSAQSTGTYGAAYNSYSGAVYGGQPSGGNTYVSIQASGNVTKNENDLADKIATKLYNGAKQTGKF